jgi:hypothetical protein
VYQLCYDHTHRRSQRGPGGSVPLFELHHRLVKTCFSRIFPFRSCHFSFYHVFLIFALNYTSVSVDFSQLKLFEIQFLFYSKKKVPPPFIEMAGSASDPIDNASCTIHVPELLRGLHLIRREILL